MLVQQRHGIDQAQVLRVIAPQARLMIGEGEMFRVRIHHRNRLQKPLRVLVQLRQVLLVSIAQEPVQRAAQALHIAKDAIVVVNRS